LFRERPSPIEEVLRNVAKEDLAGSSDEREGSEGDQPISRTHIKKDVPIRYFGVSQHTIANGK
jgi:hypothetical protein